MNPNNAKALEAVMFGRVTVTAKGEVRRARKEARAAGRPWNVEMGANGQPEMVQERTPAQERRHERAMERWGRKFMDSDPDWR